MDLHTLSFDMKDEVIDDDDDENIFPKATEATKAGSEGNAEEKLLREKYTIDGKSAELKQNIAAQAAKKAADPKAAAVAKAKAAADAKAATATPPSNTGVEAPQVENDVGLGRGGAEAKKAKLGSKLSMVGHSKLLPKMTSSTFLSPEEERAQKLKSNLDMFFVPAETQAPETPKSLKDLFNPSGNLTEI